MNGDDVRRLERTGGGVRPERFSKAARGVLRAVPQVPFTQLHELEVPNAFELLVGAA